MCSNLAIRINDRLGNGYFNESFFSMHLLFMSLINLQTRKKYMTMALKLPIILFHLNFGLL